MAGFRSRWTIALPCAKASPRSSLAGDVQRPPERQRPFLDQLPQRLALQELHHQIRHAAVDAGVRHRDDVGVREHRQRPRLALEAPAPLRDDGRVLVQHLDRHEPAELLLLRPVHDAHTALAEAAHHLVAPGQRPSEKRIGYGIEQICAQGRDYIAEQ